MNSAGAVRLIMRRSSVLAAVSASVLAAAFAGCEDSGLDGAERDTAPVHETSGLVLLTGEPGAGEDTNFLVVRGNLGVNPQGCFTVGGDILVADYEASILPSGKGVSFPGLGIREIGESVEGLGGYYSSVPVENAEACLSASGTPERANEQFVGLTSP